MKLVSPELQAGGKRARYTTLYGPWTLLFILVAGVSALFAVVTHLGDGVASGWTDSMFYCDSSGRIRYQYTDREDTVSPYWDKRLFLSVTMGFHGLSFVQAKAIDICFDLFVGRGSQVLVALATYPILRRSILRSMEVREFSLALLLPFFMERLSVYSLWAMFANMRSRRAKPKSNDQTEHIEFRKARVRIDWRVILVFLVGCYVLALPTFTSVMTSYQSRSGPYLPSTGSEGYFAANDFDDRMPDFVVPYGHLIGLSMDAPLYNDTDSDIISACSEYITVYDDTVVDIMHNLTSTYSRAVERVEGDNDDIGKQAAIERTGETLPLIQNFTDTKSPPIWSFTLWPRDWAYLSESGYARTNISAYQSTILIRNTTYDLSDAKGLLSLTANYPPSPDNPSGNTYFAFGNTTHSAGEVESSGKCLPTDGYIWGFSSLMLFTFCMITIAVALLLITLHYDAYFNSAADRYKLHISPYRDLLDLAEELRAHYGAAQAADMPAKELDKAMGEDPVATGLETETLHRSRGARWKQAKASKKSFTRSDARKRSKVADGKAATDAEESLMSMGLDVQLHSEMEMAKLPARVASRSSNGT